MRSWGSILKYVFREREQERRQQLEMLRLRRIEAHRKDNYD